MNVLLKPFEKPKRNFKKFCFNKIFKWVHLEEKFRSSHQSCSVKKGVLRKFAKFTGKHLCQRLFFNKAEGLATQSLTQVFSCEFCKISKNDFFTEYLQTTASV